MYSKLSQVGKPVAEDIRESLRDPVYRAEHERLAPYEALARIVLRRRGALGLSQAELARRMGCRTSTVSRIERGQHPTSIAMLQRVTDGLEGRAVLGFESGPAADPARKLVVF